jgi:hypothetical protein
MKKLCILVIVVEILSFILVNESSAQRGIQQRGGWGPGGQYGRMYDTKTVETIIGEVVSVDTFSPIEGMCCSIRSLVKTGKETISIHLGPRWYVEKQKIKITPKDKIEVKGSRISFKGEPAIMAAEIKKGEEILKLRDEKGFPFWAGEKKRR